MKEWMMPQIHDLSAEFTEATYSGLRCDGVQIEVTTPTGGIGHANLLQS